MPTIEHLSTLIDRIFLELGRPLVYQERMSLEQKLRLIRTMVEELRAKPVAPPTPADDMYGTLELLGYSAAETRDMPLAVRMAIIRERVQRLTEFRDIALTKFRNL